MRNAIRIGTTVCLSLACWVVFHLDVKDGGAQAPPRPTDVQELQARVRSIDAALSRLSRTSPPVGTVLGFGGQWPPHKGEGGNWTEDELGWMLADGRPLDAARHSELIAVLGTNQLPNYCGVFLRGCDTKFDGSLAGRDPDGGRAAGNVQDWATAMPRNAFSTGGAGGFNFDDRLITGPPIDDARLNRYPPFGRGQANVTPALSDFRAPRINNLSVSKPDHTHPIAGGDRETRPGNAAIHWIIKFK
jgi:hypothetical protein